MENKKYPIEEGISISISKEYSLENCKRPIDYVFYIEECLKEINRDDLIPVFDSEASLCRNKKEIIKLSEEYIEKLNKGGIDNAISF